MRPVRRLDSIAVRASDYWALSVACGDRAWDFSNKLNQLAELLGMRRIPRKARHQARDELLNLIGDQQFENLLAHACSLGAAGYRYGQDANTEQWNFYLPLDDDAPITELKLPANLQGMLQQVQLGTVEQLSDTSRDELEQLLTERFGYSGSIRPIEEALELHNRSLRQGDDTVRQ